MLKYQIIPVTPFQQNCSLIWCDVTLDGAMIDPGGDTEHLIEIVQQMGVQVKQILLTHGHLDHVGAAREIAERFACPIFGPEKSDLYWLQQLPEQAGMFGLPEVAVFTPDRWLVDGEMLTIGECELAVLHCPGHTPGHVAFYEPLSQLAFVGDVLFYRSIGRTDFPQGNHAELISSIKNKLFPLGDNVTFVPGHGPNSTFGDERKQNPFVR